MPEKSSSDYQYCNSCIERFLIEEMIDYDGYYCETCVGLNPEKFSPDHDLCNSCKKYFLIEEMIENHYNFPKAYACSKCVENSMIHNRWEILIL
ncbi:MAG: hypothetical protein ACTSSP_00395 [Candidatus Asgardarchaeia archaeon]